MARIPRALTIAGSDSGGGAGIEADLKTFAALGVYGMAAVTSVTAQNTREVRAVHDMPPEVVTAQIEAVVEDIGVDAAKTGMLSNAEIIAAVGRLLGKYGFPLVVDPVMVAKSGAPLLRPDAVEALGKYILPMALLVTPNRMEAERLSGLAIRDVDDAKAAAKKIADEYGVNAVIVKGGHLAGNYSVDVLYVEGRFREFAAPRVEGCFHGTGCSFSAAITAMVARGHGLEDAVEKAKRHITGAIRYGHKVGGGHCPVNPMASMEPDAERWRVIENVKRAVSLLKRHGRAVAPHVPEVHMNIVMALPWPYADDISSVAGVVGRISRVRDTIRVNGPVAFGASRHLARAVLTAMRYDARYRAALNASYSKEIIGRAVSLGLKVSFYDRREEPPHLKYVEGGTIGWGIESAIKRIGAVPDLVYHEGDWGKEPMVNIFGVDAVDAVAKLLKVIGVRGGRDTGR